MNKLFQPKFLLAAVAIAACTTASALPVVTANNPILSTAFGAQAIGVPYSLSLSFTLLANTTGFSATVSEAVASSKKDLTFAGYITGPSFNVPMVLSYVGAQQKLRLFESTMVAGDYTLHFSGTPKQSVTPTISISVVTPISVPVPTPPTSSVPEPETYAMMVAGLGALGFLARRRKNA
jgi:hypothetical protein